MMTPNKRGFALVIALALMAMIVLLCLSLSTLTSVELSSVTASKQEQAARQNALYALNVALGQLQLYGGADQRTTATADIAEGAPSIQLADTSRGLKSPVDGTRKWLGIWGNTDEPDLIYSQTPQPLLLNWMVSGNENLTAYTAAVDGNITTPTQAANAPFTPDSTIAGLTVDTSADNEDVTINGQPAALLVGSGAAGANLSDFIVAPKVKIASSGVGAAPGNYAYWIGDEGVKARYNLGDKLSAIDPQTSAEARYRMFSPATLWSRNHRRSRKLSN